MVPTVNPSSVLQLDGWIHVYSGKVRDIYVEETAGTFDKASRALLVASDRVSAFDHLLEPAIPGKGHFLTTLSLWWFDRLTEEPNHLVADHELADGHVRSIIPAAVTGRGMLVKTLDMFPIECVVRGYLSGSGWDEYRSTQRVCDVQLPAGLHEGDRLPEPIYTPAWKAPQGKHDVNISYAQTIELVGKRVAVELRDRSLSIYARAAAIAAQRTMILADTKLEFGADRSTGEMTLADEVLTSDSSRYWDAADWSAGERRQSFDKQIVRDWLDSAWDRRGTPPMLPAMIVNRTAERYRELVERLTGAAEKSTPQEELRQHRASVAALHSPEDSASSGTQRR